MLPLPAQRSCGSQAWIGACGSTVRAPAARWASLPRARRRQVVSDEAITDVLDLARTMVDSVVLPWSASDISEAATLLEDEDVAVERKLAAPAAAAASVPTAPVRLLPASLLSELVSRLCTLLRELARLMAAVRLNDISPSAPSRSLCVTSTCPYPAP